MGSSWDLAEAVYAECLLLLSLSGLVGYFKGGFLESQLDSGYLLLSYLPYSHVSLICTCSLLSAGSTTGAKLFKHPDLYAEIIEDTLCLKFDCAWRGETG